MKTLEEITKEMEQLNTMLQTTNIDDEDLILGALQALAWVIDQENVKNPSIIINDMEW